jgi:hypothetical protein
MVKDLKLYNKIATAFNSSFGNSGPGGAGLTMNSVKFEIVDVDEAIVKCVQTVSFTNVRSIEQQMKEYEKDSIERIRASLKVAKENFEKLNDLEGVEKKTISFKLDTKDSRSEVEYLNVFSPVKRAFYKYRCVVKIS